MKYIQENTSPKASGQLGHTMMMMIIIIIIIIIKNSKPQEKGPMPEHKSEGGKVSRTKSYIVSKTYYLDNLIVLLQLISNIYVFFFPL